MCYCTPSIRTPFCGKQECYPKGGDYSPLTIDQYNKILKLFIPEKDGGLPVSVELRNDPLLTQENLNKIAEKLLLKLGEASEQAILFSYYGYILGARDRGLFCSHLKPMIEYITREIE